MDFSFGSQIPQQLVLQSTQSPDLQQLQALLRQITVEQLPAQLQAIRDARMVDAIVKSLLPAPPPPATLATPATQAQQPPPSLQVVLSTPLGDIELSLPPQLSKLFAENNQFHMRFEPGSPPHLKSIQLVNTPLSGNSAPHPTTPVQGAATPVLTPSVTALSTLPAIKAGGIIEAFFFPTHNTASSSTAPSNTALLQQLPANVRPFALAVTNPLSQQTSGLKANQQGFLFNLRIIGTNTPQNTSSPSMTQNVAQNQATGQSANISQNPTINQSPRAPLMVGAKYSPAFTGTIVGHTPQQAPILQTGWGQMLVLTGSQMNIGTQVQFQLMTPTSISQHIHTGGEATPRVAHNLPPFLMQNWDSIAELLTNLPMLAPELAMQTGHIVPKPDSSMPSLIKFFLSAMQMPDNPAAAWMGLNMAQLDKDMKLQNLLNRLSGEMKAAQRTTTETRSGQEFRGYTFPLLSDAQIQPIEGLVRNPAYYEDDSNENKKKKGASGEVRFLVNLNMSNLGPVQIDGLLKQQRMNMILRLENHLPLETQKPMIERYNHVLETLGLKGGLTFQGKENWVEFEDQRAKQAADSAGLDHYQI